jgi:hypothetical protein
VLCQQPWKLAWRLIDFGLNQRIYTSFLSRELWSQLQLHVLVALGAPRISGACLLLACKTTPLIMSTSREKLALMPSKRIFAELLILEMSVSQSVYSIHEWSLVILT